MHCGSESPLQIAKDPVVPPVTSMTKKKNEVKTKVHFSVQLTASCLFGEFPKSFANEMWLGAAVLYHCSESGKCMKKLLTELSPAGVYNCSDSLISLIPRLMCGCPHMSLITMLTVACAEN